jgi:hypothetical protein
MNISKIRKPARIRCETPIEILWGSAVIEALVRDMSVAGLYIETSIPLWVGATFSANLMWQPPLSMNCTVSRVEPNRGMGVQVTFKDLETSKRYANELGKLVQTK